MIKAGVPVIPGSKEAVYDVKEGAKIAKKIGYPVIIKAALGGGGKGMRVAQNPEEFEQSFQTARKEAGIAFGDETMYIEHFVKHPRHIEFQILADNYGNVIHLGERDCSIQRNHQKMIEESPSVALSAGLRKKMGEAAVRAARQQATGMPVRSNFFLKRAEHLFYGNEYQDSGGASGHGMGDGGGSDQRADQDCRWSETWHKQKEVRTADSH